MSKIIVDQIQSLNSDDVNIPGTLSVDGEIAAGGINNSGPLKDSNDSVGEEGQVLTSTGEGTNWVSLDLEFATDAQLQAEADLRAAADDSLQSSIDQEILDRIAGDDALQDNIDTEEQARINSDTTLQTNITNEANLREAADSSLQSDIDQEILDRVAADNTLQSNIQTEAQTRLTADNTLNQAILDEADSRVSNDSALQESIDQEAQARANADLVLQANIDAEESARILADDDLQSQIDAEVLARTNADLALQAQITSNDADISALQDDLADEVIARQQGDTQLHNEIVAEASERASADADLQAQIDSNDIDIADLYNTKEDKANKGIANGYAPLDSGAKVPEAYLPDSILGQLSYQGTWDASTNTPTLPDPTTAQGDYYVTSVEGTYLGIQFHVGDWVISDGTNWQIVDNTDAVTSVFGRLGNVVANESDYSTFYPLIQDLTDEATARANADTALQGQITSNDNDIVALQSGLAQEITDRADADSNLQGQITSNDGDISTLQSGLAQEILDRGDADDVIQGNIDSETAARIAADAALQGQIDILPTPNNATITIASGSGLTGSGDFTTDQGTNETITISHADTSAQASVTGTVNTFVDGVTLDTYGHVTGLTTQSVTIPNPNNATITISAGTGMTGGGDFTTDQATNETITISHSDTSTLSGVYGSTASGTKINEITIDGFGHITAITTGATGDIDGITAGSGLTGGGTSGTPTISHADTSTQASVNNSGLTFIQDVTLDDFGHVTGLASGSVSLPTVNDGVITISAGSGLTGSGDFSTNQSTAETITISHADTSGQTSVTNSGRTYIQSITLDTYGHITNMSSATDSDAYVGTVTSVAAGGGLSGGTITTSGTISHADTSSVSDWQSSPGGLAGQSILDTITFDEYGHVTGFTGRPLYGTSLDSNVLVSSIPNTGVDFQISMSPNLTNITTINALTIGRGGNNNQFNTALGTNALKVNTTGFGNTAVGRDSLNSNTTGTGLTSVGRSSLTSNSSGTFSTSVGVNTLYDNTTGYHNTAVGTDALGYAATGFQNTAIGSGAGTNVSTGSNLTLLGYGSQPSSGTSTHQVTLGDSRITSLRCNVQTISSLSDIRDKTDIEELQGCENFILKLRPVSFVWNQRDGGRVGLKDNGFIAQELLEAQEETGYKIPNLVFEDNPEKLEASYSALLPTVVSALQYAFKKIEKLEDQIKNLQG